MGKLHSKMVQEQPDKLELGFLNRNGNCYAFARSAASLVLGSELSGFIFFYYYFFFYFFFSVVVVAVVVVVLVERFVWNLNCF